ncbi:hypothetical protein FB45DRAFT_1096193 [Roridomyces roridus]|uniref:Uncharacterized protein n=1 Tax=Roridomyces roridus TaxID=1738132 RepID=A0AAD7BG70_9AGAR|nr:hypothetical protein FB45DRAFT_1096193 [Roridomyces roridus]
MPVTSGGIPSLSSDSASSSRHGTDPVEPLTPTSLYRPRSTAPPGHPSSPGWASLLIPTGLGKKAQHPTLITHAHAVPNISQHHRYSSGVHPSHSRPDHTASKHPTPVVSLPPDERDAAYPPRLSRNPHHPNIYRSQMESGMPRTSTLAMVGVHVRLLGHVIVGAEDNIDSASPSSRGSELDMIYVSLE